MNKKQSIINKIIATCLALTIWQLAAMVIHQKILLVTPLAVAKRLCTIWTVQGFFESVLFTFSHIAGGFILGLFVGVICAILAYKFNIIENLLWPWMAVIKSVPVASFVVICLIWLSAKNLSVFISFLVVIPIVYQNLLTGLKSQNKEMLEMAQIFHMPLIKKIKYIFLPGVSGYIISACQITTGMAWKAGVAAEIIGTPSGSIGKMLYTAKIYLDTDDLLAWTVIIVVISVCSEKLFMKALRLFLKGEQLR